MNAQDFEQMCMQVVKELRALAPKDTGNLAYNAIQFEWVDNSTFKIFVNEEIAPYMPFTNEPWDIRIIKQGTGRKGETRTVIRTWENPNEGWFDRAADELAFRMAFLERGELKKHD